MFKFIKKRDGRIVPFDLSLISNAIYKASVAAGAPNRRMAKNLAQRVAKKLAKKIPHKAIPTVEDIQDTVESVLIAAGYSKIAKRYILYRQHRAQIRREKEQILNKKEIDEIDKRFDINALRVLAARYLRKNERGEIIESPKELFMRVATHVVLPSLFYDQKIFKRNGNGKNGNGKNGNGNGVKKFTPTELENNLSIGKYKLNRFHLEAIGRLFDRFYRDHKLKINSLSEFLKLLKSGYFNKYESEIDDYYNLMVNRRFMPNTPALVNFGNYLGMGSACFVLDIGDSLHSIMDTLKSASIIFQAGGGVGYNFSKLRPEGDFVKTTGGVASGPISFMRLFDCMTDVIKQGGVRRGANMGILNINHPDIEKFIVSKKGNLAFRNFNISVMVMPDFWSAYKKGEPYLLVNPRTNEVARKIDPRQLFDSIIRQTWESAEPGVIFYDRINEYNPFLKSLGPILSTNPCIVGSSLVSTSRGLERIDKLTKGIITLDKRAVNQAERDLVYVNEKQSFRIMTRWQKEKTLVSRGTDRGEVAAVFKTGVKEVFQITTQSGYELKATADHKFLTPVGWRELQELRPGDELFIQSGAGSWNLDNRLPFEVQNLIYGANGRLYKFNFPKTWSKDLGRILGWLIGDGWFSEKHHALGWVFAKEDNEVREKLQPIIQDYLQRKITPIESSPGVLQLRTASRTAVEFFKNLGVLDIGEERRVPQALFTANREAVIGFIEGLFSADGTIGVGSGSRNYIRLNSSSLNLLKDVQLILLNFGIKSVIYNRSTEPKSFFYKKANGKKILYQTSGKNYELNISKENLTRFAGTFEFLQKEKNFKLQTLKNNFGFCREYFTEKVKNIDSIGKQEVWDLTETKSHSFIANGFVIKNCGEVALYPNESCNLGSINVWAFVKEDKKGGKKKIDWKAMEQTVKIATRFLDNVIDVNKYPLSQIEEMTLKTRKIGLGVMGLGDLLYDLEIPYNSKAALNLMEKLMEFINYHSKTVSIDLAKERGMFPLFKESSYKDKKLPMKGFYDRKSWHFAWDKLAEDIKKFGIRNGFSTVVAPTGSISMICGCSSGIEPIYSLVFEKQVVVGSFYYLDPVFEERMQKEGLMDELLVNDISLQRGSVAGLKYIPKKLKDIFVTALDIAPEDHIKALAAIQKWTDSSVSKTINFPREATIEDMKKSYLLAYELGCKGLTVFRDTSIKQQVLLAGKKKKPLMVIKDEKAKGLAIYHGAGLLAAPPIETAAEKTEAPQISNGNGKCSACGTPLVKKEGCQTCPTCGWGKCL